MLTKTLLMLLLCGLTPSSAQRNVNTAPLTEAALRQAVDLWMGSDHNRAEITGLIGHISDWDTSQITSFNSLFKGQTTFDEDLSGWNTSSVTDMADMFNGCSSFRGKPSLELWDTSKVTTMARMFKSATTWEGDLSGLDTSSATDMSYMFQQATLFKGEGLQNWDVSKVVTFNFMFNRATNFNEDIGGWNTESAEFMEGMFEYAVSFDQNISSWNVDRIVSVGNMFEGAASYDQSLCWPGLSEGANVDGMFCDSHLGAHLDPCCVAANTLIENACCGGNCDTFCPPLGQEGTRAPYSNDPPAEDDNLDDENEDPTSDEQATQPPSTAPQDEGEQDNDADSLQDEENSEGEAVFVEEEKQNLWQREVWLRIFVYIVALILLAIVFYAFLRTKSQPSSSHTTSVNDTSAPAEDGATKDPEIGIVTTNLTDLTDTGDDKKEVGVEVEKKDAATEGKEDQETAPPESPKK